MLIINHLCMKLEILKKMKMITLNRIYKLNWHQIEGSKLNSKKIICVEKKSIIKIFYF